MKIKPYISIARPGHWFKNLLIFPGVILASIHANVPFGNYALALAAGFFSTCLLSSASYVLNEWLDSPYDRFHPIKKKRPSITAGLRASIVYMEHAALALAGLALAALVSTNFLLLSALFCLNGAIYNVRPLRLKDVVFVDVLVESFNNPLRLYLGWFIVAARPLPPESLAAGYWAAAAFLLGLKRFAEMKLIGNAADAARYRASFKWYSKSNLLGLVLISGALFWPCFFVYVFRYRIELLPVAPFAAALFAWLFFAGLKKDSPMQQLEGLFGGKVFAALVLALVVCVAACLWPVLPRL